ncbi:cation:proton antiporter [Bogoriella caseilytica]|uniref:Multisubunit sodium/proton antiporter MrpG subunit n=1 Tax=Bogoriella caseilytica TaxID=56055 RepID=A0A3N2BCJ3_9MICO|nr:monovalent cation/H(+) antiporter subunit G [Bogoriella caseilytica]ROR72970.1 multisubunit sodium/proton antiporter MrpG subunit [Bogoriella caseilytica]
MIAVLLDLATAVLVLAGAFFFTAGTAGLIRFPGVRNKLHALTKADNLGLGLVLAGVALHLGSWAWAGLLLLTWLLALGAAAASAHLLGGLDAQDAPR